MATLTANQIFQQEYHGAKNFITPRIIKRGKMCRNIAYELSVGNGIVSPSLYGVTIVMLDESTGKTEPLFDDSHCFNSLKDAQAYIDDYKQRC